MPTANAPLSLQAIIDELGFTPADGADLSSHVANVSNPHGVTKTQVGLGSVENVALSSWAGTTSLVTLGTVNAGVWNGTAIADAYISSAAAWNAKENASNKATNFVTVNDTLYPSVQAVKAYADALVVGLLDDRGNYDASSNAFPSSGGSGTAGAILKGDLWLISVAGTLGGTLVAMGDQVRALTDTPGQTASNWAISEANIGYVSENVANKVTSFSTLNNTLYPSTQAVSDFAQPKSANLTTYAGIAPSANVQALLGAANYVAFKTSLSLENVENTALSTWAGSSNIVTAGTITSGGLGSGASLGSVSMSLGSDANGDVYYRASGVLTRLPKGTAGQVLTMNAGATAPEWAAAGSGGANAALSNLSSVAINTALLTGAGVAAALTATAPAQITTAQAGIPASLTASVAVAGSSVAGAAAGGSVSIIAGNAARLTSGNANGGDINLTTGAGIGTGLAGNVVMTQGSLRLPDGSINVMSVQIGTASVTGLYAGNANDFDAVAGTSTIARFSGNTGFFILNGSGASGGLAFGAGSGVASPDVKILRAAAGVAQINTATVGNKGWWITEGAKRVATQFDKTNTTVANVTGLSLTVNAGRTYSFRAVLHVTADATGGVKFAMGGSCTATAIIYQVNAIANTTNANALNSRQTALGGEAGVVTASETAYFVTIEGTITVNAGGTLTVQFAQNVTNGTSSVLVGSSLIACDNP